jgi:tetratricopeptide (TPR) repeat protein
LTAAERHFIGEGSMSSQSLSTIPRQPRERTFVFAVSVLGVAALVQAVAVLVRFAPEIRNAGIAAEADAVAEPVQASARLATPEAVVTIEQPSEEIVRQAQQLVDEGDRAARLGDWPRALALLAQADRVLPGEPGILFKTAETYYYADRQEEAFATLRRVLRTTPNHWNPEAATIRAQAAKALKEHAAASPPAADASANPAAKAPAAGEDRSGLRDDVGIPIGSVIGIVDCQVRDDPEGFKILRLATKASPSEKIDPGKCSAVVWFYEKNDIGEIVQTESSAVGQWLSEEIDWSSGEPELLEVKYSPPAAKDGSGNTYYGYMAGIYYKRELQDSRIEPVSLQEQAPPLPLYMADMPE